MDLFQSNPKKILQSGLDYKAAHRDTTVPEPSLARLVSFQPKIVLSH